MYRLLVVLSLMVQGLSGLSQKLPGQLFFEHVILPGAIRSTQVTDIVQDKYGLIWVGGDGLFRYDGFEITNYQDVEGVGSIGGREINALYFDELNNRLLIGTHSHGLIAYSYETNRLTQIPFKGQPPIISKICQTTDGTIWVNSFSDGLHQVSNDTIRKINDPNNTLITLTSILSVGNKLWASKRQTIYVIEGEAIVDTLNLNDERKELPEVTRFTAMMIDSKGRAWIGTERSGVMVYDTLSWKPLKYFSPDSAPFYNRINAIYEDSSGLIWMLAKSNGVAVYSPQLDKIAHITRNPLATHTLSGDNCAAIIEDTNGIIWIGATGDLNKYDRGKVRFRHIYQNLLDSVSLADNMVRGIFEDRDGQIWIGTDGGTVHRYDRREDSMMKLPTRMAGLRQRFIPFYFTELNERIILIGSSLGLMQYNKDSDVFSYFEPLRKITQGNVVRQVLRSRDELFLTMNGTLIKYNLKTGAHEQYENFSNDQSKQVINATAIYIDSRERLWLGVTGGIVLYNSANNTFKHYPIQQRTTLRTGSYFMILALQELNDKIIIGTFNYGIWIFDPANPGDLKEINEQDGLPNNTVYATIPDDDNNLWITTNRGIAKFSLSDSTFQTFSVNEGLQQEEFNRQSFFKCKNGDIVFGGINGVNIFNPKEIVIEEENYAPRILSINTFSTTSGEESYTFLSNKNGVKLSSSQNFVDINFFVPVYSEPKRYEVFHRLEGYDRDWVRAQANSTHYSNIEPGTYQFQVKTVSYNGKEQIVGFALTINPPFWNTPWFIGLAIIVVIVLVVTIIQSYSRRTINDKKRLESQLQERTREITKSREDLANLNQKKDLIFSILSHDLRSPLTTLKGFLTVLIEAADSLTPEELRKHATSIRNSVTSSLDLIDNTLFWSLSQTGNISYTPSSFSLNEMLRKLKELYQLTAEKKKINFTVNLDERVDVYADENMIYVTLRNIVSNAIKFTPEGKSVTVEIRKNHQLAEIKVTDEGVGMSESYLNKLFAEEHLQIKKGTSNEKGTGLGLVLCKKFVDMNNGFMKIQSEENNGTEFTVQLPLSKN